MKRTMAIFGATVLAATGAITFTACDTTESSEKTVMNVSLNPEVEFVLDENNTVISANALNEEGNLILSAGVFNGKSADAAVDLFIEISAETGFLVSGNAALGDNEIDISFSGDQAAAEKLFNNVKEKALSKLEEFGVKAEIKLDQAISQEDLRALVEACAPYLSAEEIENLEVKDLIDIIYESRKETKDFYSQELKNAYYEAKEHARDQVELEYLKSQVSEAQAFLIEAAYKVYEDAVATLEEQRYNLLVSEESSYQKALVEFRAAKAAFLQYRHEVAEMEQTEVTEAVLALLDEYKAVVEAKEDLLEGYAKAAHETLDALKETVKTAYDTFVSTLKSLGVKADEHLNEVSNKQKEAHDKFFDEFEDKHGEHINNSKQAWEDMREGMGRPGGKEGK